MAVIFGIGLAVAGATVEQASSAIPIITARTNGDLISTTTSLPARVETVVEYPAYLLRYGRWRGYFIIIILAGYLL